MTLLTVLLVCLSCSNRSVGYGSLLHEHTEMLDIHFKPLLPKCRASDEMTMLLIRFLAAFFSSLFLIPSPLSSLVAKSGENGQSVPAVGGASGSERLYWPAASALTARLRRLITAYQRSNRREQLRQEALNRPDGRRRRRREFLPSIAMVTDTGGGATYIQDGAGVFMAEGSPYLAKGSAYFAKGGQFMPEASPVMTASSLMADGAMYYKERRQR